MTKLKEIRESRGLSQRDFANQSGISLRTLQDYEQGRRSLRGASVDQVHQLAQALHVTIEELCEL